MSVWEAGDGGQSNCGIGSWQSLEERETSKRWCVAGGEINA
jgi:hypothetical protein